MTTSITRHDAYMPGIWMELDSRLAQVLTQEQVHNLMLVSLALKPGETTSMEVAVGSYRIPVTITQDRIDVQQAT